MISTAARGYAGWPTDCWTGAPTHTSGWPGPRPATSSRIWAIPAHKIRIIHNGVDPAGYRPADEQRARTLLGIDPQRPVVGVVGRLSPEKDHVLLLQAARRLVEEFPDLAVLVVGDGPMRRRIEHAAAELGLADRILLVGPAPTCPTSFRP